MTSPERMNYIYYFKSTVNNYFFEISQPNPKRKKEPQYSVFALDGIRDYSSSFVPFESQVKLSRSLYAKTAKKLTRSGQKMAIWSQNAQGHLRKFTSLLHDFSVYVWSFFKISEDPVPSKKNRKRKKKKKNSKKPKLELIPHMCGITRYKQKKFLFLNPNYIEKKIVIPPLSNYNLPRGLVFDFKSQRQIMNSKHQNFYFDLVGENFGFEKDYSDLKSEIGKEKKMREESREKREQSLEMKSDGNALVNEKTRIEDRWKLLEQEHLDGRLDNMVLVIKNNVTSPFIIPIKSLFLFFLR